MSPLKLRAFIFSQASSNPIEKGFLKTVSVKINITIFEASYIFMCFSPNCTHNY